MFRRVGNASGWLLAMSDISIKKVDIQDFYPSKNVI